GRAIDVNPVENPYVTQTHVSPPAGEAYVDRSQHLPGMVHVRDPVWWAFHAIGWAWGGTWTAVKDYQHFSANGR
ncbi:MAG: M15 family metallopeptidase, partial [Actinomycetota bacterium]